MLWGWWQLSLPALQAVSDVTASYCRTCGMWSMCWQAWSQVTQFKSQPCSQLHAQQLLATVNKPACGTPCQYARHQLMPPLPLPHAQMRCYSTMHLPQCSCLQSAPQRQCACIASQLAEACRKLQAGPVHAPSTPSTALDAACSPTLSCTADTPTPAGSYLYSYHQYSKIPAEPSRAGNK